MTTISKFKEFETENFLVEDYLKLFENENENDNDTKDSDDDYTPGLWNRWKDRTIGDYKLNFFFLTTFGASISALFPVVNSLVKNMGLTDVEINKETIVLLTLCALAILFNEEKSTYKKMFEELRLRGVYDALKKIVSEMEFVKKVFTFIAKSTGKLVRTFSDMFAYTALLIPFLHAMHNIVVTNHISLDTLVSVLDASDILSVVIGLGTFAVKNFIIELIHSIKNYTFKVPFLKRAVDKIHISEKDLDDIEAELDDGDIKKYTDYTDQDLIQDDYVTESVGDFGIRKAIDRILTEFDEEKVGSMIDEEIFSGNWLDDDWEDEFDDEYEAYIEQGRGEAESAVISQIKDWYEREYNTTLEFDDSVALQNAIEDEFNINTN